MNLITKSTSTIKLNVQNALVYKQGYFFSLLVSVIAIIIQFIFWNALYNINIFDSTTNTPIIADYSFRDMITYIILTFLFNYGNTTMSVGGSIKDDILSGNLGYSLIRPYNYFYNKVLKILSGQIIIAPITIMLFVIVFTVFKEWVVLPGSFITIIFTILSILLSYCITFLISSIMGIISFWILETSSLDIIFGIVVWFLSGALFPLNFITGFMGVLLKYLPFGYMTFFSINIFMERIEISSMIIDFFVGVVWVIVLTKIFRKLWDKGIKKYSSYGG